LLLLAGVKVQPAQLQFARFVGHDGRQLAARPVQDFAAQDLAFDLGGFARAQRCDRRDARFVFVAQRQMQNTVVSSHQAQAVQLALHVRERCSGGRSASGFAGCGGGRHDGAWLLRVRAAHRTRMASTSNCAPSRRRATPRLGRAGNGCGMISAMMALAAVNLFRSVRNSVSLTILSNVPPASLMTACILANAWRTWASKFSDTRSPVPGSSPIWPDKYTVLVPVTAIACEYGPTAAGASSVWMICLLMDRILGSVG